jgi:hypothetical protein
METDQPHRRHQIHQFVSRWSTTCSWGDVLSWLCSGSLQAIINVVSSSALACVSCQVLKFHSLSFYNFINGTLSNLMALSLGFFSFMLVWRWDLRTCWVGGSAGTFWRWCGIRCWQEHVHCITIRDLIILPPLFILCKIFLDFIQISFHEFRGSRCHMTVPTDLTYVPEHSQLNVSPYKHIVGQRDVNWWIWCRQCGRSVAIKYQTVDHSTSRF